MVWTTENVLLAISAVCQLYYVLFSVTSLCVGTYVLLPEYCGDDKGLLKIMTFMVWYIFLNMMGNFACIIYKSKLSIVKQPVIPHGPMPLSSSGSEFINGYHNNNQQHISTNNKSMTQVCDNNPSNSCYANPLDISSEDKSSSMNGGGRSGPELLGGWKECKNCEVLTPPRGKHCPLCKHCVLKRDHHCFFVGKCIGFHNQRFFTCFCLYGGLGGLYALKLAGFYLRSHYSVLQDWGLPCYFVPVATFHWILGYTSGRVLGMLIFWWWSLFTAIIGFWYFGGQIILVVRGQTKYEFVKDIRTYRGTVMANVYSVFGRFWPVNFFIPTPFFGYVGDGTNWDDFINDWKFL